MKKNLLLFIVLMISAFSVLAQTINESGIRLYHTPSQEEIEWASSRGLVPEPYMPTPPPTGQIRPIAEFEPSEGVLINYGGNSAFGIPMSLIKSMAEDVKVIIVVASTSQQNTVLNTLNANGVNTGNCEFLVRSSNSWWTRDYGPWFIAVDNNQVGMFDFTYNRPARPQDNQVNATLATHLNIDRYTSTLTLTGGNYMNDGILQGASTNLTLTENGNNETYIRSQFQEYLGMEDYHFMADCIAPYDNIQHIDCWSKMLSPNKVLVTQTATSNPNYNKFEAAATYFASQTSSWGMPYQVYRVYEPAPTSSSPVCAYTNSLILNKKVYVPLTGNTNDAAALQVYQDAMPGYEIIGIQQQSSSPWYNTDALHCRVHEIADRQMLFVQHNPYFGEMENTGNVVFNAEIFSYGNHTLFSDSVIVYLRIAGGDYTPYTMEYTGENVWEVSVSGLPSEQWIEYYIFAADESGRRECHPYIGAANPHKFTLIGGTPPPQYPVLDLSKTSSQVYAEAPEDVDDFITVYNFGEADLTFSVSDISFESDWFRVSPENGTVQAGDSLMLTLSYHFPARIKSYEIEYEGTFNFLCNDPLHPETVINLYALVKYENSIQSFHNSDIAIYPNPAYEVIKIRYDHTNQVSACIYSRIGQQLENVILTKGENLINVHPLPKGIYFIKIEGHAYKFVKM